MPSIFWQRVLQVLAIIFLFISIAWYICDPGFEPLLAFLGGITAGIGSFFAPTGEPRQSQSMPPINLLVLVHKACFSNSRVQHFFIKVINNTPTSEIEITHVWYENDRGPSVEIMERPLPKRLKPFETWETWVSATRIPELDDTFQRFRAKTSTGEVFTSRQNVDVRPEGYVAL